ncbi:ComEA family DNA-binding protein [Paenibacillus daejeonensis]|uniref:ComEA family DNA-binding protein n=1 Tax=Paenibacillus daejeonensis TaxID=135193 RepID=UPI00035E8719|nr:helix-hairpin-helix domain-containing protein [Paenibacillus daejeonensis]
MKTLKRLLSTEKRVTTLLLAGGALLLLMALGMPREDEPEGWKPLDSKMVSGQVEPETAASPIELQGPTDAVIPVEEPISLVDDSDDATGTQPEAESEPLAPTPGPEEPAQAIPVATVPDAAGKIDINRASAELLDTLPGIGAAKAQAIIADREQNGFFRSADDIIRVRGIGPKMLEKMKEQIVALP